MRNILLVILIVFCIASAGCISSKCPPTATTTTRTVVDHSQQISYIDVSPSSAEKTVGYPIQFKAKAYDSNDHYLSGKKITWSVSDSGTGDGSINKNGLFVSSSSGTVTIYAKAEGVTGKAHVTIKKDYHYYRSYNVDKNDYVVIVDDRYRRNRQYDDDDDNLDGYNSLCNREHNHLTSC
jgi:hypothetical protein